MLNYMNNVTGDLLLLHYKRYLNISDFNISDLNISGVPVDLNVEIFGSLQKLSRQGSAQIVGDRIIETPLYCM